MVNDKQHITIQGVIQHVTQPKQPQHQIFQVEMTPTSTSITHINQNTTIS